MMDRPPAQTLNLGSSIGAQLTFLSNRLTATGSATYRNRFGLGILDARLLIMLGAEPDISPSRICEVTGLDGGAVSRALRGLAERGLVTSRADPRHSNYKSWSLTAAGACLHAEIVPVSMARDTILLEDFSAEERALLIAMVDRMLAKVDKLRGLADRN